ncbi:response regulator [Methylocystis parvus]|uniref:Response regulator n=1 Tax=Methylocystis parvus TaxID=134 RepID=A0A6B8LYU1_9HYPH|nr:response regulator [Methylocystis parvus]QGM97577.1 response regulator [Methylocystis parvus]WBJ98490.1 response regulator [Methylocystis parvus OBBP]
MTRILIVEDEAMIALYLSQELSEAGYRVIGPAASNEEALQLIDGVGCDGALLDVDLGCETSEVVAIRLRERGVLFAALTGYAASCQPVAFENAPILKKPVCIKELLRVLRNW